MECKNCERLASALRQVGAELGDIGYQAEHWQLHVNRAADILSKALQPTPEKLWSCQCLHCAVVFKSSDRRAMTCPDCPKPEALFTETPQSTNGVNKPSKGGGG